MKHSFAATLAYAALGSSHLIISKPVPFGLSTLNNSPLLDAKPGTSGSDYPCKQRPGVYDITTMNHMKVGEPEELSFTGSASHGGGTCQLAVSLDKEPTANSTFKIIQVFEGGCPIDSDGNGMTHPFTFTIPPNFPNGVATLAWMWYNRIGNREAYMNCAPITVTGGSDNTDYYDTLPNMYIINLPTSECQSTQDYASDSAIIPFPGQFFMKEAASQSIASASGPSCAASAAAQTQGVAGYKSNIVKNIAAYSAPAKNGDVTGPAPTSASAGAGSAMPSATSGPAGSSVPSATSAPAGSAAASSSSPAHSSQAMNPSASSPIASASISTFASLIPSANAGLSAPASALPTGSSASSCSITSEAIVCSSSGKEFGVCDNGSMVWRPVAPGTECKAGGIVKRDAVVVGYGHGHVRKHARHVGRVHGF